MDSTDDFASRHSAHGEFKKQLLATFAADNILLYIRRWQVIDDEKSIAVQHVKLVSGTTFTFRYLNRKEKTNISYVGDSACLELDTEQSTTAGQGSE